MFVRNPVTGDPRVVREALALVGAGHAVTVIGRSGRGMPRRETHHGVSVLRLPRLGERLRGLPRAALGRVRRGETESAPGGEGGCEVRPVAPDRRRSQHRRRDRLRTEIGEANYLASAVAAGARLRADAYHAHDLDTLEAARLCARLTGARLIYDSHELWIDWQGNKCGAPEWRLERWRAIETRGARAADRVITVSDALADELVRLYDIERPLVLRNCAPLRPLTRSTRLRALIGGAATRPIVLYQGGFSTGRGLDGLVTAAELLPEVDVVLIGAASPYRDALARRAEGSPHRNVHVLPRVSLDALWELTVGADLGVVLTEPVCLSYEMSLSNKVFEYMVAGLPILGSTIASHRALADETGALLLADAADPADLAAKVRALAGDPERLLVMGRRARAWAERKYNAEAEQARLVLAYAALGAE